MPALVLEKAIEMVIAAFLKFLFQQAGDAIRAKRQEDAEKKATDDLISALLAANTEAERERATGDLARGSWAKKWFS